MLRYVDIQNQVLTYLDEAGETDHTLDVVKLAIQTAHDKRLTEERWSFMLWPNLVNVQFNVDQRVYQLHPELLMMSEFTNLTAKQLMKETPTRARWDSGNQEDRYHYEFVAPSPVRVQPTVGLITVTGEAFIRYLDASGNVVEETVTNAPTSGSVSEILEVTSLTSDGLTLVDSAAVNILTLGIGVYGKSYPQIRLFDDGRLETGQYRFYKKPVVLTRDNDIPNIPYPFSRVLVFDALLELATYNDSEPPQYWVMQQELWDRQLRQAYQEGESEGSEIRRIHEVDTYAG